jgi:hypothetical protein
VFQFDGEVVELSQDSGWFDVLRRGQGHFQNRCRNLHRCPVIAGDFSQSQPHAGMKIVMRIFGNPARFFSLTLSIKASCESSSDFLLQVRLSSVEAKICEIVPKRWNNIAVNWMIKINAKKNTNTKPIGSSWRYSFVM